MKLGRVLDAAAEEGVTLPGLEAGWQAALKDSIELGSWGLLPAGSSKKACRMEGTSTRRSRNKFKQDALVCRMFCMVPYVHRSWACQDFCGRYPSTHHFARRED